MENSSVEVLEFAGLLDLLRGYAASDLGRAKVALLAPSVDLDWIQYQQQLTSEVREFRRAGGNFNLAGLLDISGLLDKARISGAATSVAVGDRSCGARCTRKRRVAVGHHQRGRFLRGRRLSNRPRTL